MKNLKDISVVIPIYNEESNINELYERLTKTINEISSHYEVIFVNDGSDDGAEQKILQISKLDPKVFYINFNRNFGHQIAVSAGLEKSHAKCTVIMDGDLQDPPELISKLYERYKEGFDVVYAKRNERKGESYLKKLSAKLFYRVLERLTSFSIPLDSGDFRLIDKKVVIALNEMSEQNKFLRGQIAWLGFSQSAVGFDRDPRKSGTSGYSYSKMIRLALDAITSFFRQTFIVCQSHGILYFFYLISGHPLFLIQSFFPKKDSYRVDIANYFIVIYWRDSINFYRYNWRIYCPHQHKQ